MQLAKTVRKEYAVMNIELKTERLLLRPLSLNDVNALHEYYSDEENTRYITNLPYKTIEATRQYIADAAEEWEKAVPHYYVFAIELDGTVIGNAAVSFDEYFHGLLYCIINKLYWRNGYAAEALSALKNYLLHEMPDMRAKQLLMRCDHRNKAAAGLAEKIGFAEENSMPLFRFYSDSGEIVPDLVYVLDV